MGIINCAPEIDEKTNFTKFRFGNKLSDQKCKNYDKNLSGICSVFNTLDEIKKFNNHIEKISCEHSTIFDLTLNQKKMMSHFKVYKILLAHYSLCDHDEEYLNLIIYGIETWSNKMNNIIAHMDIVDEANMIIEQTKRIKKKNNNNNDDDDDNGDERIRILEQLHVPQEIPKVEGKSKNENRLLKPECI